ncbi:hypothetical protein PsW64_00871 [Pseudovibrio sp. W64]|uniref:hypothetical protein n=1 Tax=Pseudovibrio sp. W64 TaxID=1735583 RepID=UPI0007B29F06|nr:hypothetical protein [Pseudovibrio sp. W64]KZK88308.1 hypothetical protein PsW64_00871 [Pseudovibrio sp. W64]
MRFKRIPLLLTVIVPLSACGGGFDAEDVASETDLWNWSIFEKACISSSAKGRDKYLKAEGWKVVSSSGGDLPLVSIAESRNFNRKTTKAYRSRNGDSVLVLGEYKSTDATEASPTCYFATSMKYGSVRFFDDKIKSYVFDGYKRDAGSFSKSVRISGGVNRTSWINELETASDGKQLFDVAGVSFVSGAQGSMAPSLVLRVNK